MCSAHTDSDAARARYGWESDFPTFAEEEPRVVRISLQEFLEGVSEEQVFAWDDSIPKLQHEVGELVEIDALAQEHTAILEYELPLESRRPDVVLLVSGAVVVLELKGKSEPDQADLDQAAAYARDLRCYHRHCADREVHAVVVPTRAHGYTGVRDGVHVAGPDALHELVQQLQRPWQGGPLTAQEFLAKDAYCPLPTLVQAARELFLEGQIRPIHRARACTDPAVEEISRIAHEAARTRTRHLVLVTGVPGSGKTLVGLRAVHWPALDDLAVERPGGKPTSPAIFLSGNGPLVQVLQYELRGAGGGGKAFVRDVKNYMKQYLGDRSAIPPHHVIVYDEAQRAWDVDQVAAKHPKTDPKSEPEAFIEFGERVPEWCVLVGLIGSGQEINVGEEAGLGQWRAALLQAGDPSAWTVHAPQNVLEQHFDDGQDAPWNREACEALDLKIELRFHFAADLDRFVDGLLADDREWTEEDRQERMRAFACTGRELAAKLEEQTYHLRMTRDLDVARTYLRERYADVPEARFGILASARDKELPNWGIPNDWNSTKQLRLGPWYGDGEESPRSCRRLLDCVTEFSAQGLELDGVLLAWGTDLVRQDATTDVPEGIRWSDAWARRYQRGAHVKDPFQLRLNAYRVLMTRGRDCTVIFVPPIPQLDATHAWFRAHGVKELK
jgi:hypothetical protein